LYSSDFFNACLFLAALKLKSFSIAGVSCRVLWISWILSNA